MANPSLDAAASSQHLFASLRSNANRTPSGTQLAEIPSSPGPQEHNSPTLSPSLRNLNTRNYSRNSAPTMSNPSAAVGDQSSNERTANLLNLLKFGAPTPPPQNTPQYASQQSNRAGFAGQDTHSVHGRGISASDLVGSFMGKSSSPLSRENVKTPQSTNHQDVLLKLLNRSQHSNPGPSLSSTKSQAAEAAITQISQGLVGTSLKKQTSGASDDPRSVPSPRHESPIRFFGSSADTQVTPFEPQDMPKPEPAPKQSSIFTYVNPFEQLAASSPSNAKAIVPGGDDHKRKLKEANPEPNGATRRKLTPAGSEVLQSIESPAPARLEDGRTQVEALMGIGAPTRSAATVSETLNEVGSKVEREADKALAKAEAKADEMEKAAEAKKEQLEQLQEANLDAIEEKVYETAREVKKELDKEENDGLLEETMPPAVAEAVKEIIDDAAQNGPAEAWESADGDDPESQDKSEDDRVVRVYQFPLKPFVSIDIRQNKLPEMTPRDDAITYIARLKKEFDQTDRTLATATSEFIVYGSPKSGGLKVIRQEDGLAKQIFADIRDRIFNASLSASHPASEGAQAVLATGISGAVYWATVYRPGEDLIESNLDNESLIFPPVSTSAENTSGGQLKTRAKKSSRHPEFFAIGRGKSIHILFPMHARSSEYILGGNRIGEGNTIDTENYLKDRNIKITTGKAGKDFTFSEDDSLILSLDKAGKLKFWDIRDLVDHANASASKLAAMDVKTPLMTLITASSNEKSWPTSVLFVDKLRPYTKGIAHRYVLVGMKQNHTLQLWDLCLGKAVQELNFPHEKETDPICSVTYHPGSGIIVVGHPTRNSIYFIHLSAPKYNLPGMVQSKFIQRLANKDSTLPKPEATAIMSGVREYSFGLIGQIRSVDLMPYSEDLLKQKDDEQDPTLFELYVMHSKGVTSLGINKGDLGWSKQSKVLFPVDAESEGHILVKDLRELSQVSMSEQSSINGDHVSSMAPAVSKQTPRDSGKLTPTMSRKARDLRSEEPTSVSPAKSHRAEADLNNAVSSTTEKAEKKKKKKRDAAATSAVKSAGAVDASSVALASTSSETQVAQHPESQAASKEIVRESPEINRATKAGANGESINLGISSEFLNKEMKKIEDGVSAEISQVLSKELETLYRRFDDDKRVQSAASSAKQDAILRLVSSTLSDNVEKSLSRIIENSIQQTVIPAIADVATNTLEKKMSETMTQQLHTAVPPMLKLALPEAISRGVQNPEVLRLLSEQLSNKLASRLDREFSLALHNSLLPSIQTLAVDVAQKVSKNAELRVLEQYQRAESQRQEDIAKINQLTDLVRGLSENIQTMAAAQSQFQQDILTLQQQLIQERHTNNGDLRSSHHGPLASGSTAAQKSPEQEAVESVTELMSSGRLEEGTIMWLQSDFQESIFDKFLVHFNPAYLRELSALLSLSVGTAVTSSFDNNISERLTWLETALSTVDLKDPELRNVGQRIMDVLKERLESQYMHISEVNPQEPALRRIPPLARAAREMLRSFR